MQTKFVLSVHITSEIIIPIHVSLLKITKKLFCSVIILVWKLLSVSNGAAVYLLTNEVIELNTW